MKKTVYLAGNISHDPATYEWRKQATKLLEPIYDTLDPASNRFNKQLIKEAKWDDVAFKIKAIERSQNILISKDYQLIQRVDIILANLTLAAPEKPMIGTMFELAWAWQLRKPIIAVIGNNWYGHHPFIVSCASAVATSVESACHIIQDFFEE